MAGRLLLKVCPNISGSFLTTLKCSNIVRRNIRLASALFDAMQIRMPSLSPTMQTGTIIKWHKKEGDAVAPGDLLCDIQTDKAVLGFEIEEEGILAKILKPDNTTDIKVGSLIAIIAEVESDWQNVTVPAEADAPGSDAPSTTSAPSGGVQVPSGGAPAVPTGSKQQASYGPAVRNLIELYNIKPEQLTATGPRGWLIKGDVLKYIEDRRLKPIPVPVVALPAAATTEAKLPREARPAPPPVASAPAKPRSSAPFDESASYVDLELTTMRSVIAQRLTLSKTTIPHSYGSADCNIGKLLKLRQELLAEGGVKVGVNDFIIKAAAVALQKVPQVNAVWGGEAARLLGNIDISVAVATDNGLITPIVKDAIGLGVEEISLMVKDLAARARVGKLRPDEFQGGSFTISNLGMFGISSFSAVINPPQVCILAVGGSRTVLDEECQPQSLLSVTISSDARVVDEALASQFLQCFQEVMENPELMLSHGRPIELAKLFAK